MTSLAKGAIGLGGLGTVAGGGLLAHSLAKGDQKSALIKKLESDKFTILNLDTSKQESENSGWQKIFLGYSSLSDGKENRKIGNLTLSASGDKQEGINQLKKACSSLLNTEGDSSNFEKNYQLATQWCVEPVSIESLLQKQGTPFLDTGANNNQGWTEVAKAYEKAQSSTNKPLNEVTWSSVSNSNYDANITNIKNACNTRKTKSSHEEGFLNALKEAQSWCTARA
ncbi:hypothetical protein MHF_1410 [Mycoplasma haemofelis Ohio2]|uniref:Uncharacterized protein n=1 Tax=Mycoplasma haemofelis (strain Ohio2) TaxID=859194 RepID=F6FGK6_MYCHI|nr:hypothetical protein MHF_1410 [Mycoplasma haemofelis Ohio2]